MKKNLMKAGLAVAAAVVMLSGCGDNTTAQKNETAATSAQEVNKKQDKLTDEASVKLGEYKGLTFTTVKDEVTEDEVDEKIHSLAVKYPPEITDRAAKLGDTANLDYEGKMDGVAFSGGTAYSYDLKLGSGQFIEGFEDGVIGMMPGEEKDLALKFPEEYHNAELAGKDAVFHVKLNHVTNQEYIEINDELAKRVKYNKDATLEQLREETRQSMLINAEVYYYLESASELLEQVVANSEITVDPDAAKAVVEDFKAQYSAQATLYGMDYKSFLAAFMSTTPEKAEEDVLNSLKEEMVMDEIIRIENIQATDEQKDMIAKINGCTDVAQLVDRYGEEQAEKMYGMYAGTYFLINNAAK